MLEILLNTSLKVTSYDLTSNKDSHPNQIAIK